MQTCFSFIKKEKQPCCEKRCALRVPTQCTWTVAVGNTRKCEPSRYHQDRERTFSSRPRSRGHLSYCDVSYDVTMNCIIFPDDYFSMTTVTALILATLLIWRDIALRIWQLLWASLVSVVFLQETNGLVDGLMQCTKVCFRRFPLLSVEKFNFLRLPWITCCIIATWRRPCWLNFNDQSTFSSLFSIATLSESRASTCISPRRNDTQQGPATSSDGSFANKSVQTNDSLTWMNLIPPFS